MMVKVIMPNLFVGRFVEGLEIPDAAGCEVGDKAFGRVGLRFMAVCVDNFINLTVGTGAKQNLDPPKVE